MASGEIRLSTMTMRLMPVLAQNPNLNPCQFRQGGCGIAQPPPPPCSANRGNNPNVRRNIGIGALGGGLGIGALAAVNIVGFPEVEAVEGIGGVLGGLSALGDFGLITLNFGTYGATAGGIAGYAVTPGQCGSN
jgi:hypothetical protein